VLVIVPFWISVLVRTYAWMVMLGRGGLVNTLLLRLGVVEEPLRLMHNFVGVLVGMTHVLLPFAVLPMYSVMKNIDRDLLRAAENLGANRWQSFRRVFFPLSLLGVVSAAALVFVSALGFFITPALLVGPVVREVLHEPGLARRHLAECPRSGADHGAGHRARHAGRPRPRARTLPRPGPALRARALAHDHPGHHHGHRNLLPLRPPGA